MVRVFVLVGEAVLETAKCPGPRPGGLPLTPLTDIFLVARTGYAPVSIAYKAIALLLC